MIKSSFLNTLAMIIIVGGGAVGLVVIMFNWIISVIIFGGAVLLAFSLFYMQTVIEHMEDTNRYLKLLVNANEIELDNSTTDDEKWQCQCGYYNEVQAKCCEECKRVKAL